MVENKEYKAPVNWLKTNRFVTHTKTLKASDNKSRIEFNKSLVISSGMFYPNSTDIQGIVFNDVIFDKEVLSKTFASGEKSEYDQIGSILVRGDIIKSRIEAINTDVKINEGVKEKLNSIGIHVYDDNGKEI